MTTVRAALIFLVYLGLTACASQPASFALSTAMPQGEMTAPPSGFSEMCGRDPTLCQASAGNGEMAQASLDQRMDLLNRINRRVNAGVRQVNDPVWRRSGVGLGAYGDCKDLALEKRQELIDAGYDQRDLYLAVGYQHEIGLHAVLIAHTEQGDYVLDSRTPYIVTWREAPYIWVLRQAGGEPGQWTRVAAENAPAAQSGSLMAAADTRPQTGS